MADEPGTAMAGKDEKAPYELIREGARKTLLIDTIGSMHYPSIEDNSYWMAKIIDFLLEVGSVDSIVLSSDRNYVYPYEQAKLLNQIKDLIIYLVQEKKILGYEELKGISGDITRIYADRSAVLRRIILDLLKKDPLGAYVELIREIRKQKILLKKQVNEEMVGYYQRYIDLLDEVKDKMEETELISLIKDKIAGYRIGDRDLYREIFEPLIKPNFMFTRLMAEPPSKAIQIDSYIVGGNIDISLYKIPNKICLQYHVLPPEFKLKDEEYELLNEGRAILAKHRPKAPEFLDPRRMRELFFNISKDLLTEIAKSKKIELAYSDLMKLSNILVRLTVGFGLAEVILFDEKVEDIYINAPIGTTPIIVKHSIYGECHTNIVPSIREGDAWASRFRIISGRPLDEANPVLDTELITEDFRARASIVQQPLSPYGLSFALRRHRAKPWTLPLFIDANYLTPLAAGLIWFLIDGARTILVAGTRGSGKSSLLGALLVQIMRKYRIITVEDTLELPTEYLRGLKYDILPMKVRSAIVGEQSEMSAEDGIRTTLRLGDSCLIVGEVRSTEAKALYEAMRVGALANVVAGTIHGDSPYGVFDRVVNDLGVPPTSFKATDIIILCNKLRTPDGLHEFRRVTGITEIRKHWQKDPLVEKGFQTLMSYDAKSDKLLPEKDMIEGESEVLKAIASRSKEWVGRWDDVWANILLRSNINKTIVDYSKKLKNRAILEADFVVLSNDIFHEICEKISKEVGTPEPKRVFNNWERWLKIELKKRGLL